uniref:BEN domain-containing protein n=1 Tax=Amphimedon queenslandica TaxID=400682 RepID=A0A1X7VJT0_AMPQE
NRQNLKTLCDKLINFEITIEEVLAEVSSDVEVTPGSDVHRGTSDETVDSTTSEMNNATKARATEIFSTMADDERETNESVLESKLYHQEEMISQLKRQLDDITFLTNNLSRSSQNNIKYELHQPTIDFEFPIIEQTPPGAGLPNPKCFKPTMIELVLGYGILLAQRQLDEAISSSGLSPTKLMRNLISIFFTQSVLATSSCCGSRLNQALDEDVVAACIKFVESKYSVAKSVLVEAINDECSTARRKMKKKDAITINN